LSTVTLVSDDDDGWTILSLHSFRVQHSVEDVWYPTEGCWNERKEGRKSAGAKVGKGLASFELDGREGRRESLGQGEKGKLGNEGSSERTYKLRKLSSRPE